MDEGMAYTVRPGTDGWIIEGAPTPRRFRRQQDAAAEARRLLHASGPGGLLTVHDRNDVTCSVERVAGAATQSVFPAKAPAPAESLAEQVKSEGEQIDKWLEFGLPIVGSAGAAWISPEVSGADGWFGVFFATLSLSLGCLFAVVVAQTSGLQGYPLLGAVSGVMLVAVGIASSIGAGVLDISSADLALSSNPYLKVPVAVVLGAVQTWGVIGAALGAGIGIWLGVRVSARMQPAA